VLVSEGGHSNWRSISPRSIKHSALKAIVSNPARQLNLSGFRRPVFPAGGVNSTTSRFSAQNNWIFCRCILAFLLLPNAAVQVIEFAIRGDWHPLNLDYLLIGVALLGSSAWQVVPALAAVFLLDAMLCIAPVFHFESAELPQAVGQLFSAQPIKTTIVAAAFVLIALALGWWAGRMAAGRRTAGWRLRLMMLFVGALLYGLDALNGTGQFLSSERTLIPVNLAGSSIYHATMALRDAVKVRRDRAADLPHREVLAGTTNMRSEIEATPMMANAIAPQLSLVLVESLGLLREDAANLRLLEPLLDDSIQSKYEVHIGRIPFHGPTTAGEFRELCGIEATYVNAPTRGKVGCLPLMLQMRGYHTVALHGFRPSFFERSKWYPSVGFERMLFEDDLIPNTEQHCGTMFDGACDNDVAKAFSRELLSKGYDEPKFVYWLTLSSHFPVDARAVVGSSLDCRAVLPRSSDVTCLLMKTWWNVLVSIRSIALNPQLRATRFVIVGDHSPPFIRKADRDLFDDHFVPFVDLVPRGGVRRPSNPSLAKGSRRD
jgi:hypothetical protein